MHKLICGLSQGSAIALLRKVGAHKLLAIRQAEEAAGNRPEVMAAINARIAKELCAECGAANQPITNGHCSACGSAVATALATSIIGAHAVRAVERLESILTDKRGEFKRKGTVGQ